MTAEIPKASWPGPSIPHERKRSIIYHSYTPINTSEKDMSIMFEVALLAAMLSTIELC